MEKIKEISESTFRMSDIGIFLVHFLKEAPHYLHKGETNIEIGHWLCRFATDFLKKTYGM